jgi:hypothetical protein
MPDVEALDEEISLRFSVHVAAARRVGHNAYGRERHGRD